MFLLNWLNGDEIMMLSLFEFDAAIGAATVFVAIAVSTIVLFRRSATHTTSKETRKPEVDKKMKMNKDRKEKKKSMQQEEESKNGEHALHDVWAERQKKGVAPASLHHRSEAGSEKPIGSSYYYAHNTNSNTGGYKDGLRMEDYTMNQPRLLSRGGQPVQAVSAGAVESSLQEKSSAVVSADGQEQKTFSSIASVSGKRTLPISKYLWDDPGSSDGVATIRIDRLPSARDSVETIEWKDAGVLEVQGQLLNDGTGLLVTVKTDLEADYQLEFKRLYGKVAEVKTTVVRGNKRLLVRLKKQTGLFNKSNTVAWPHPHQKV